MSHTNELTIPSACAVLERGTYSWMWVVKACPYCGKKHEHYGGPLDGDPRTYIDLIASSKCDKTDQQYHTLNQADVDRRYALYTDQSVSAQKSKATVRWFIEEGYNKGNLAVVDEVVADNIVCHSPLPGQASGRAGINLLITSLRSAFPDLQVTVEELIVLGNMVFARVRFDGTHLGTFMDILPTGLGVTWTRIMLYRFADGKIIEHWSEIDPLSMLQQRDEIAMSRQVGAA